MGSSSDNSDFSTSVSPVNGFVAFDSKDVTRSMKPSSSRAVLCAEQAQEIFRYKSDHGCASLHAASACLARRYRVSSKAIRDIWKGRSWLDATYDLWNANERPARRMLGRPKGKKDSMPRKSKSSLPRKTTILVQCPPRRRRARLSGRCDRQKGVRQHQCDTKVGLPVLSGRGPAACR